VFGAIQGATTLQVGKNLLNLRQRARQIALYERSTRQTSPGFGSQVGLAQYLPLSEGGLIFCLSLLGLTQPEERLSQHKMRKRQVVLVANCLGQPQRGTCMWLRSSAIASKVICHAQVAVGKRLTLPVADRAHPS